MNQTRVRVPVYFPYTFALVVVQLVVEVLILMVVAAILFSLAAPAGASPPYDGKLVAEDAEIDWPEPDQEEPPLKTPVAKLTRKNKEVAVGNEKKIE